MACASYYFLYKKINNLKLFKVQKPISKNNFRIFPIWIVPTGSYSFFFLHLSCIFRLGSVALKKISYLTQLKAMACASFGALRIRHRSSPQNSWWAAPLGWSSAWVFSGSAGVRLELVLASAGIRLGLAETQLGLSSSPLFGGLSAFGSNMFERFALSCYHWGWRAICQRAVALIRRVWLRGMRERERRRCNCNCSRLRLIRGARMPNVCQIKCIELERGHSCSGCAALRLRLQRSRSCSVAADPFSGRILPQLLLLLRVLLPLLQSLLLLRRLLRLPRLRVQWHFTYLYSHLYENWDASTTPWVDYCSGIITLTFRTLFRLTSKANWPLMAQYIYRYTGRRREIR